MINRHRRRVGAMAERMVAPASNQRAQLRAPSGLLSCLLVDSVSYVFRAFRQLFRHFSGSATCHLVNLVIALWLRSGSASGSLASCNSGTVSRLSRARNMLGSDS